MGKILLVQRNTEDKEQLENILHLNRFDTLTASSVNKALGFLDSDSTINLIITSVTMSVQSGWDILRYVKQDQKLYYLPIIMTSDEFTREDVVRCAKYRVDEVISKPFAEDVVIGKVRKAISRGKPTVLIVDDEKGIVNILKYVIELEKITVLTANNAEDGMKILENSSVDAIISDIMLPGMTGVEFMTKAKEKYDNIPVVLITGWSGNSGSDLAKEKLADGYFRKPFNNRELVSKLKQVMPNQFQRVGS
ncbi:MAG: response regulator [candidate division Zixibacteria bacterium]